MNYLTIFVKILETLLPGEKIIQSMQNVAKLKPPVWYLQYLTSSRIGTPTYSQGVDDDGNETSTVTRSLLVRLQFFGEDSFSKVEELRQNFSKRSVLSKFYKEKFSIYDISPTIPSFEKEALSQLASSASIDIYAYYSYSVKDYVGQIDKIEITGEYEGNSEIDKIIIDGTLT